MDCFNSLPGFLQWLLAIVLLFIACMSIFVVINAIQKSWWGLLLLPLSVTVFQFSSTPFLSLVGIYKFLSPMLLVNMPSDKKYELHNGTPFNYLLTMRKVPAGYPAQNKLLRYYVDGLLKIVESIEAKDLHPEVAIEGTSYFFSEQTAQRLGFSIQKPPIFWLLNAALNYVDLTWMYSYSKGRLCFPKLSKMKKAVVKGADLVSNKAYLLQLKQLLKSRGKV